MLELLHKCYQQIAGIEQHLNVVVNARDFRPRIEWFHDAVRAFTSGSVPPEAPKTRLSIESLALDMERLRGICAGPLHPRVTMRKQSASQAVVPVGEFAGMSEAALKVELTDLYANYTVFFVALLAETADYNFYTRTDAANQAVTDLVEVEHVLRQAGAKAADIDSAMRHTHLEPTVQAKVKKSLEGKKKPSMDELMASLNLVQREIDKDISSMDGAHFSYAASQLAMYEQSKDMVKKLAGQGLNLAGRFLEESMQRSGTTRGRGM